MSYWIIDCNKYTKAYNAGDPGSIPGLGRSPGEGNGNPLQYSCLEKIPWQKSLVGYSPWGCKESDTTEQLSFFHFFSMFSSVAELCPTLHDPMDRSTPGLLSITNSWSLLKLMPTESVMRSNHFIFCCTLPLLPSIFPSIKVFTN